MEIIIRPAVIADVPSILDIVNHAILHTTANYNYEPQTLETQLQWFKDKQQHNFPVIVAEFENQVIGYGAYGTFREKIGYQYTVEHSVYVADNHFGKGIGKLLLTELIRLARAQNYHVMIGAIDADNADSIAFHKKFGFEECGVIKQAGFKFGKWLDLLFMQLILK
ncbi:GNAT family N-acetyltransferase [Flavobacterium sp.]|uniref:GNAT family N-acetyltransferase n=1 Tax=Flavobacterium sp. TaxID=239 RepID=UPI0039E6CCA6